MIKIGVIGAGRHSASSHGPALKFVSAKNPGEIELSAVCDLDIEKAEYYTRRFEFGRAYNNFYAMLEKEELSGIVAVTPTHLTRTIAGELLEKGIPLLIEKPAGKCVAEAQELLNIADRTRTPHMISFNRRFNPAILHAKKWIRERGDEYRPSFFSARMLRTGRNEENFVMFTGIHAVDTVMSFSGVPVSVTSQRMKSRNNDACLYNAQVKFKRDEAANIFIAPEAGRVEETYEIYGSEYFIRIDVRKCSIEIYEKSECVFCWEAIEKSAPEFTGGSVNETEYFIECIKRGSGCSPNMLDGLLSMKISTAIQNSHTISL